MIHTAKIDASNIVENSVITETESYLNEHGFNITDGEYYSCVNQKPEGENSGYLIKSAETTRVPFEQADIVSDTIEIYLCSCGAYRYRDGVKDLEQSGNLDWEPCKHIKALKDYRVERAKADDNQHTLV